MHVEDEKTLYKNDVALAADGGCIEKRAAETEKFAY